MRGRPAPQEEEAPQAPMLLAEVQGQQEEEGEEEGAGEAALTVRANRCKVSLGKC